MAKRKCKACKNEVESTAEFCPLCGNKFKKNNIFLFTIAMFVIFVLVLEILFPISMVIFQHGMIFGKYGESALLELLLLAFVVMVLLFSGNGYVFSDKRKGFFRSLLVGLPMLLFSTFILFTTFFSLFDNFKFANLISLVFLCILVGLAEEFLCRAWLQNEFLERFGSSKKGVIISILISSLVFGLMHITNLFATPQGFVDTLMQILQALASGFLFGAIYYRTKNIWTVAFLHGFFDFSLMLGEVNTLKGCVSAEYTTGALIISTIASIFLMLFYVFSGIYALSTEGKPEIFKDRTKAMVISIVALVVSITSFFVFSFITGGSDDTICYEFNEKEISEDYDVATTARTVFTFRDKDNSYYLETNKNDELVLSNNNKDSVTLTFDESVQEYIAIENNMYVDIVVNCYEGESIIYFERLEKVDFEDTKEYLEKVRDNFKKIDVPDLKSIGYVVFDLDPTKYPYLLAYGDEEFFIDLDEELYMIKK